MANTILEVTQTFASLQQAHAEEEWLVTDVRQWWFLKAIHSNEDLLAATGARSAHGGT